MIMFIHPCRIFPIFFQYIGFLHRSWTKFILSIILCRGFLGVPLRGLRGDIGIQELPFLIDILLSKGMR